jgi:4-amino-4-deoxy-L-arabinose transferase-like glycosyltransferase
MTRTDRFAIVISVLAFAITSYVSVHIFEAMPHIEDEITFVWQARLAAHGDLEIASPVCPECFLEPFVIDSLGYRYGKYPPGWPAMLSLGVRLGVRSFVNPFLAALSVWLTYRLVKKLLSEKTAIIAAVLTTISPFFLMNSGSLLAHSFSLLLALAFSLSWIDTFDEQNQIPKWMTVITAGLTMGLLALTRPLTAVGISIPFLVYGIIILIKGNWQRRKYLFFIGGLAGFLTLMYFVWQYAVTGNFLTNPYVLYWPYDRIGFGPEVGLNPGGHQLKYAWVNTKFSMRVGLTDFFGWPMISWIFIPFGIVKIHKNWKAILTSSVFPSLVLAYAFYWIGAWVLGPRYYYEGLFSLTLLTAAGIDWLAGWSQQLFNRPRRIFDRFRFVGTMSIVGMLVFGNLYFYIPQRVGNMMHNLYGIGYYRITPFLSQEVKDLEPALVIVQPQHNWLEYGGLLDLSSPYLDTPLVFTYYKDEGLNQQVIDAFPDRNLIYYYPAQPDKIYVVQRSTSSVN